MTKSMHEKLIPDLMFDQAIIRHGFTPYLRDYDIVVQAWGLNSNGAKIGGQYRYRFTHVPYALTTSAVGDENWRTS